VRHILPSRRINPAIDSEKENYHLTYRFGMEKDSEFKKTIQQRQMINTMPKRLTTSMFNQMKMVWIMVWIVEWIMELCQRQERQARESWRTARKMEEKTMLEERE
jgi:hypothetical protein